jgi:hypothetical protein
MSDYEYFRENNLIKSIYDDKELIEKVKDQIKRMKDNPPERSYNNIESWFNYENDVSSITIGSKTIMNCDPLKIFAILAEVDVMNKFVQRFDSIEKLEELTLFRWIIRIRIKMPITIDNREVVCIGFGFVDPVDKTIFLPFRSINKDHYSHLSTPAEDQSFKRIEINYGFFHLKILGKDTVEVINCYNVDPKVPVIPWMILNTFLKEISYYIMVDLKKQILDADFGLYEERIKKNQHFYDALFNKVYEK